MLVRNTHTYIYYFNAFQSLRCNVTKRAPTHKLRDAHKSPDCAVKLMSALTMETCNQADNTIIVFKHPFKNLNDVIWRTEQRLLLAFNQCLNVTNLYISSDFLFPREISWVSRTINRADCFWIAKIRNLRNKYYFLLFAFYVIFLCYCSSSVLFIFAFLFFSLFFRRTTIGPQKKFSHFYQKMKLKNLNRKKRKKSQR